MALSLKTLVALGSFPTSFFVLLASLTVYYICYIVYNIYFHPLSKFPGPKRRTASWIGFYWYTFTGTEHIDIKELHEAYGDVVRISPNTLSFNSPSAWRDIYGFVPGKAQLAKEASLYRLNDPEEPPSIIGANDRDHARMRKLLSHGFSSHALLEQEPLMDYYFNLLISRLQDSIDSSTSSFAIVDMSKWFNYTTFDLIGDLTFGTSFECLSTSNMHSWVALIFESIRAATMTRPLLQFPFLQFLGKILLKLAPKLAEARSNHIQLSKDRTRQRLAQKDHRMDFVSAIRRHGDVDARSMTVDEIFGTMVAVIIAGSETTATLLSGCLFHLLSNPSVMTKVQEEVRNAYGSDEEITIKSTARLSYLQLCLTEAMRIYPPVPTHLPRVTKQSGDTIGGHEVPGNTIVGVHLWATSNSASNFYEPSTFAPERWASNPPSEYINDNLAASQPFSMGPRGCLGKNLALAEMRSILARVLWHFDLELQEESRGWDRQRVFVLWQKEPLMVTLKPKKM